MNRHVQIRSMGFFNYSWFAKNQPKDRGVFNLSGMSGSDEDEEPDFAKPSVSASKGLELTEFYEQLSPWARGVFKLLCEHLSWTDDTTC